MGELQSVQTENPFSGKMSGYGTYNGVQLLSNYQYGDPMRDFHTSAHEVFRDFVLDEHFACIAGQAAVRTHQYAFCAYPDMTSPDVAEGVCHDLARYKKEFSLHDISDMKGMRFISFIAAFEGPIPQDQLEGSGNLYQLLGNMYQHDVKHFQWDPTVSADIHSTEFSYSSGGDAFFIPLMFPFSGSPARKSEMTFVVFNAHLIFEKLRKLGGFDKLKSIIRGRQDWVHPALADHGEGLEWKQYALIDEDEETQRKAAELQAKALGECPFRQR